VPETSTVTFNADLGVAMLFDVAVRLDLEDGAVRVAADDLEAVSRLVFGPHGEGDDRGQVAGEVVFTLSNK